MLGHYRTWLDLTFQSTVYAWPLEFVACHVSCILFLYTAHNRNETVLFAKKTVGFF